MANCLKLFAVCGLLLPVFGGATELLDPTLPPASIAEPVAEFGKSELNQSVGLQSILISRQRRAAIIDGETVELGGRLGEAKLIEVNEGNVVLKTAQGWQVLTLFPDVNMIQKRVVADAPTTVVRTGKHHKNRPHSGRRNE